MSISSASQERAARAASPGQGADGDAAHLRFRERVRQGLGDAELLVFLVGCERFGIEIKAVDEVLESPVLCVVPEAPPALIGVFSLRDQLLPLYAPGHVLGPAAATGAVTLVMRSGSRRVGLAVDDVEDILPVVLSDLRPPPAGVSEDDVVAGLLCTAGRLIAVLDARALVAACAAVSVPSAA
jgi:chemotaxis signal transduction protein